ncbi:hypothetical protein ID866_3581 [Astraeus odoratus]|nr:hypothetical protein ID866_3581 [Astraeus odoratus]
MLGLLNAIQSIGMLAGLPFSPYLSDGIGRRKTVFLGAATMVLATALQTASHSVRMFIAARFLIGCGVTIATNAAPLLVTELAYPKYRAQLTSLYNSLWFFGAIVAAWATYGTFKFKNSWAWRLPSLFQGAPSILQCVLIPFAPESPRWLVSKGKEDEALHILAYYHADGNEQDPLVQYEFQEIKAVIEFEHNVGMNTGWKLLFSTPGNRRRMRIIIAIALFTGTSGNGLIAYYLFEVLNQIGVTSSKDQLLINGLLQLWCIFWAFTAALMVDKLGRRFLFLTSSGLMTLFYTIQTVCFAQYSKTKESAAGHAFVGFVFLFSAANSIGLMPLIISYSTEILPLHLRAKGLGVVSLVINIALVFNQYVNPIAFAALQWKYYLIYIFWLGVQFVFLWFFVVEVKNRTLEETAAIFDGEDAVEQITHKGEMQGTQEVDSEGKDENV